jgi:hypothetical protein
MTKANKNKILRYAAGCYYSDSSSTRFLSGIEGDLNLDYMVAYFATYDAAQDYLDGKDGYFKIITLKTPVINAGNSFMRYYSPSI